MSLARAGRAGPWDRPASVGTGERVGGRQRPPTRPGPSRQTEILPAPAPALTEDLTVAAFSRV
ncbi:hypothetical protein GCM10010171_49290 [Actinokineospora fastidiosa]|uniref:Uncharacterized protein n=1 Tax=Actinokineospora fastidiosa TaxID=1816 RepID=A0A918LHJ7_9PSEU|nr:hypothetical protein GCM10010171_49290 [Actinokineospora fastidiosa]